MTLTARQKLKLVQEVQKGAKISSLCRKYGISRFTFYKWYGRWKENPCLSSLKDQRKRGRKHWKGAEKRREKTVFEVVLGHPEWSSHKIAKFLTRRGLKISNHGVQGILERNELNKEEKRLEYRKRKEFEIPQVKVEQFTPEEKLSFILAVTEKKEKIASICRKYGISRYTFYKWFGRYQTAPDKWQDVLLNQRPKREKHWRFIPEEKQRLVLNLVVAHPEYSCHRLASEIKQIGHHGIQNILLRNGLNTYQKRLVFAQTQAPVSLVQPITSWLDRLKTVWQTFVPAIAPAPPPRVWDVAKAFFASFTSSSIFALLILFWLSILSGQPTPVKLGLFFASISLSCGTFFFAYSMKYYFTLAVVLSFSRQAEEGIGIGLAGEVKRNGNGGWLSRIFGLNGSLRGLTSREVGPPQVAAGGLQPSLDHIKLKRYPFVSIHLPFYNEKKVANRILSACTSFDYENYEVIVIDDSTDETVEIVKKWEKHPKVKLIHRGTREGFKGGALQEALKHTDPRTEFIVVFDADFIPYPDTLELFMKYFQVNGLDLAKKYTSEVSRRRNTTSEVGSNVAAVAGYQWHVLNKSENWITRGVRTEYAGSYVIERPGQEILGAMKLIHGSVYAIRADILKKFGWGTSITEDFELTLRLYAQGYKVVYTPYVQAPAECVSTLKRLIRQRMRWSEGHSYCVKRRFTQIMTSPLMTLTEKLEFLYLSPYYLQAFFFLVGTFSWLLAETVFRARLPFWTSLWGWSLVLTNFFSLPLVNAVGLFLEESEEKDYLGLLSFIALSYILVPFQAYASVKGFLEKEEGPWFRTPKTGLITDIFTRGRFYRWISGILPGRFAPVARMSADFKADERGFRANPYVVLATANNRFENFRISKKRTRWVGRIFLVILLIFSTTLLFLAPTAPYFIKPKQAQAKGFGMIIGPPSADLGQANQSFGDLPANSPSLEILNVYSHPKEGEDWIVDFKTVSRADLTITPEEKVTIDDLDFVSLTCDGQKRIPQILKNDVIFYPNWECKEEGRVTHRVNVAGKHTLKFQFGDQEAHAYNSPDTVTYYFNSYGLERWNNYANLTDGNIGTYAWSELDGTVQLLNGNSCPGTDLGTISTVELSIYGYTLGNDDVYLRPVFGGSLDGNNHLIDLPASGAWSSYVDITTDTNAPSPWTWTAVQNLDCDVEDEVVGTQDYVLASRIDIRVTYSTGPTPYSYPYPYPCPCCTG